MSRVHIERRFCGPPQSGNGGYVAGRVAEWIEGGAEVTLRRPPPLERSLERVERDGAVHLVDGVGVVAVGRALELELDVPAAPSYAEAEAASRAARGRPHPFPTCFVCGPEREPGDGLRILPGPHGRAGEVAAPWVPDASLGGVDGRVASAFLWAALDCQGGLAVMGPEPRPVLLGRMTARLERPVFVGKRYVALGFRLGREGRKHLAGTALLDEAGRVCGRSRQIWLEPR